MTTPQDKTILADIKAGVATLKPSLDGLLLELNRLARSTDDARDFVINELRDLTDALDRFTAQLARLS